MTRFSRPQVEYDATNPEHRSLLATFVRTQSWGHSPYQFFVVGHTVDVNRMILDTLRYYNDQEFGNRVVDFKLQAC